MYTLYTLVSHSVQNVALTDNDRVTDRQTVKQTACFYSTNEDHLETREPGNTLHVCGLITLNNVSKTYIYFHSQKYKSVLTWVIR